MVNKNPIERIYPKDSRVKRQTIAHHTARYLYATKVRPPKGKALDIACGSGYGSEILRKSGYKKTIGIDKSGEAISFAGEHYPKCEFYINDITLFIPDGRFGLVTLFETIEHLTHKDGLHLLKNIRDVLDKNGLFMMSTPRDNNGKYNTFHKSEWPYTEIKNVLGSIFSEVTIYGQDWDTSKISSEDVPHNDFYIAVCKK